MPPVGSDTLYSDLLPGVIQRKPFVCAQPYIPAPVGDDGMYHVVGKTFVTCNYF